MYQYQELTPCLTPCLTWPSENGTRRHPRAPSWSLEARRVSWNLAGISLWDGRASKALEDWASDPWMRWDQSGPLGGLIPVRASPTLAVGEDEEGDEGGGEGH